MMTMLMNHVMMAAAKAGAFLSCAASNVHTAVMMDATAVASIFAAIIMIISLIIIISIIGTSEYGREKNRNKRCCGFLKCVA